MLNDRLDRNPIRPRARISTVALMLVAAAAIAAAQTAATYSGTLFDSQGGVLPGAHVTLTNSEGKAVDTDTNRSGQFRFTDLSAGDYALDVRLPGFKNYKRSVSIANTNVAQTIVLELGVVQESITVDDSEPAAPRTSVATARSKPPCGQQPTTDQVRIGGNVRAPIKIKDVRPEYPATLRGTGATAEVVLDAVIGVDGFVHDIRAREGSQQAFVDTFVAAVTQWQFESTLLNCVAVETPISITGRFHPQAP